MFDYINNMQLALAEKARRSSLKAAAGGVASIGAGFLVAALWSWLTWGLGLGATVASLIVGGLFLFMALIIWLMAGAPQHPMPSSDDLKNEVEARLGLAADAALNKARFKAEETMDNAQARVSSLINGVESRARGVVDKAEATVHSAASGVSGIASGTAQKAGLTRENVEAAREKVEQVTESRAAPGLGLAGAFAVGMAVAGTLRKRRRRRQPDDYYADYDYYDRNGPDDWYRG